MANAVRINSSLVLKDSFWRHLFWILVLTTGFSVNTYAQFRVNGKITMPNGENLAGATILEDGTSNGSSSDAEGKYTIMVKSSNSKLVVSFIGFVKQVVPVNGKSVVNITLQEDETELAEMVVIGYGTVKKT